MSTQFASYPGSQHNGGIPGQGVYPNSSLPMSNQGYNTNHSNNALSGFSFRKRMDRIDWRKIAAVDVESITRNLDFNTLQDNIMNITFCNIETEVDVRSIDPNFLKLFKLAQLTIEYLLHSQDYLTGNMSVFDQRVRKVLEEHEMTQKKLEKTKQELDDIKKESHKRKKMLMAQQQIIQAGTNAYNKCPYCSKAFVNATFLQSHLARRHQENVSNYNSVLASQIQQVEPALIQPAPAPITGSTPVNTAANDHLNRDLLEIKERLQQTESQLVEEKNTRNAMTQKERAEQVKRDIEMTKDMDKWRQEQLDMHRQEMENMRELFMRELKEMGEKYSAAEQALYSLQKKRQSNLGDLTDDTAENQELLRQQREEVAVLKEQLLEQVSHVEEEMQQKFVDQEQDWKTKFREASREHKKELQKLNSSIEQGYADLHNEQEGMKRLETQYQHQLDGVTSIMKKSKKAERKLKEQETVIEDFSYKPSTPPQPEVVTREPAVRQPRTSNLGSQMQPDSEESDEESMNTTTRNTLNNTGTGTFTGTSTGGTGTLGTFQFGTGSLSLSGTKSIRLIDEVKRNPNVLKMMKQELKGNLEAELERRGISKDAVGISGAVLQQKMSLLKNERQHTAKKHKNFYDIRQQFLNELELLSKSQLKQQNKERTASRASSTGDRMSPAAVRYPGAPPPPPPRTPPTTKRSSSASAIRSMPSPQPQGRIPQPQDRSPPPRPTAPLGEAPKPVPRPRSTSPRAKSAMSTGTLSSTGRSMTLSSTASSSQWDDSDEDEDYTDSAPPKQLADDNDDDEDDWDDDEISELDAIPDPTNVARARPVPTPSRSTPSPKPKGEKVQALSRSIELQLQGRGDKKPVGGVNTLEMKKASRYEDDDDSFPTVSSEEESVSTAPPKPSVRFSDEKVHIRSSQASGATDQSNTYNTDMWGSGSRAVSTAQGPSIRTTAKNSTLSSTDWDSD